LLVAGEGGGLGREPGGRRHGVCAPAPGEGVYPGGYGNAATVRGCARGGPKRGAAARRARPAVGAAAGIRGRTPLIAEIAGPVAAVATGVESRSTDAGDSRALRQ